MTLFDHLDRQQFLDEAPEPWARAEAERLLDRVEARRRQVFGETDWPADPAACRRLQPLVAAVEDAEWAKDLAALRKAVAALLEAIAIARCGGGEARMPLAAREQPTD
jgi:hypothetical protein